MLTFTVEQQQNGSIDGYAGEQYLFTIMADKWCVLTCTELALSECASLLHALETGIAASARWTAVGLLKDPARRSDTPYVPGRVALCLEQHAGYPHGSLPDEALWLWAGPSGHWLRGLLYPAPTSGYPPETWVAQASSVPRERRMCASKEQALSVLIERAAPWIAAALEKEIRA